MVKNQPHQEMEEILREDYEDNPKYSFFNPPPDPGHKAKNCPRVEIRMGCYACGYPECEATFPAPDFFDYLKEQE